MRATWLTAAITGILFSALLAWAGARGLFAREAVGAAAFLGRAAVGAVFLVTMAVGVFGLAFFRDVRAAQRARGLGPLSSLSGPGDLRRFFLPVWGRMLAWFVAAGAAGSLFVAALR